MKLKSNLKGVIFALIGFSSFSFMDGFIKYFLYYNNMDWFNLILYVAIIVLIVLFFIILLNKKYSFKIHAPLALMFRSIIGVSSLCLVFFTLPKIHLDIFYSLIFISPIIASILAIFTLNEHLNIHKLIGILGGFIGILIITRPWNFLSAVVSYVSLLPILCACGDALIGIIARKYLKKDKPITLVFYQFILTTSVGLLLSILNINNLHIPNIHNMLLILLISLLAILGYIFYTAAVQNAPVQIVLPIGYIQIVIGIIFGIKAFNHYPNLVSILGIIVIILCSLYISLYASFPKQFKK